MKAPSWDNWDRFLGSPRMHTDNRKGSVEAEAVSVEARTLHSGMSLSTCVGGIGVA